MGPKGREVNTATFERVVHIAPPKDGGRRQVTLYSQKYPEGTQLGRTDGRRGEWEFPSEMWNQESLQDLVDDLETEFGG